MMSSTTCESEASSEQSLEAQGNSPGLEFYDRISSFVLSQDGKHAILIFINNAVLWSLETNYVVYDFRSKNNDTNSIILSRDNKFILIAEYDVFSVWEIYTQKEIFSSNQPTL